jgi:hypothetical protein
LAAITPSITPPFLAQAVAKQAAATRRRAEGCPMSVSYYRLLLVAAASLSLSLAACGSSEPSDDAPPPGAAVAAGQQTASQQKAPNQDNEPDSESTIWTVFGLAKKPSQQPQGPQTGETVSPTLWQAAHDTLDFIHIATDDPIAGALVTDWYTPKKNPNERFRITVFISSRAVRSDACTVSVQRQVRQPDGKWVAGTVDRQLAADLENAILQRARQIRTARASPE